MARRVADLLVLVGPSGSGKSTLISLLMKEFPDSFGYSVSHTTRQMRNGETNGVSYHFVDPEEFRALVARNEFLEHAVVHETYYGTSIASVKKVLAEDRVCLMDLDLVGAQNLRKNPLFKSVIYFVVPPTFEILEDRLRKRGTETEERIKKRLADGRGWCQWFEANKSFFDASFVNDDLQACYEEFRNSVMSLAFDVDVKIHSR